MIWSIKIKQSLTSSLALTVGVIGGLFCIPMASATTIVTGQVKFSGTMNVALGGLTFFNGVGTAHLIDPGGPNSGGYAGLTGGSILDLLGPQVTGAVNIPHFLTFNVAGGTVFFDLQNIAAGLGTNAACASNTVGNVCTPLNSPFTLIQRSAVQVEIDLSVSGVAYTGVVTSGSDPTTGLFTMQNLISGTIVGILAGESTPAGTPSSYLASLSSLGSTTGVPEPGTLTTILAGLGMIGGGILRHTRRS